MKGGTATPKRHAFLFKISLPCCNKCNMAEVQGNMNERTNAVEADAPAKQPLDSWTEKK